MILSLSLSLSLQPSLSLSLSLSLSPALSPVSLSPSLSCSRERREREENSERVWLLALVMSVLVRAPVGSTCFSSRLRLGLRFRLPLGATTRTMATQNTKRREDYCTGEHFFLDPFAERQFDDPNYKGARILSSKSEFTDKVNAYYVEGGKPMADGYAPFCKHVFVPNFVGLPVQAVEISSLPEQVKSRIEFGYIRRTPKELAVLATWLPDTAMDKVPEAKMLDIILYSREQIVAERVAQGDDKAQVEEELPEVDWGIISIKVCIPSLCY